MAEVNSVIKISQTEFCKQKYETPSNGLWGSSPEKTNQGDTQLFLSSEEPDLNLGLSLNGLYARSSKEKNLIRSSSSVAGFLAQDRVPVDSTIGRQENSFLSLSRSCSLPAETNETAIKLRDLQTMRRMAAKKRLVEKQRNCRDALDEDKPPLAPTPAPDMAAWAAASAAKSAALSRAISKIKTQGYVSSNYRQLEGHEFLSAARDNTESHSPLEQRSAVKPPMVVSSEEATRDRSGQSSDDEPKENPLKKLKVSNGIKAMDNWMDVMNNMPSVTTTGDGPNGRRIEGFLYKYTKGQVSIVCVCHGSFLSPAEFVRHAGGKEVTNPMKHIHVCTAYRL